MSKKHAKPDDAKRNAPNPDDAPTRRYNCRALRTLHALERTLERHIRELEALRIEDLEAAEAVVFAIEAAEKALEHLGVERRRINKG